jgi:hypothetical protein
MSKQNANAKSQPGAEVRDLDAEEAGQVRSGYRRIEAGRTKGQGGETPADPAAPASPAHIMADELPTTEKIGTVRQG